MIEHIMKPMSKLKSSKMPSKYYIVSSIDQKENNKRLKKFLIKAVLTLLFVNGVILFGIYLILLIYG